MANSVQVGTRWRRQVRINRNGLKLSDDGYFETKAEADSWGEMRHKELLAQAVGGFAPCTVRELLERWRDEKAPKMDSERTAAVVANFAIRRLDEMGLADMQLQDFGPKQMWAYRKTRLPEVSPVTVKRQESTLKAVWAAARHPEWHLTDMDPFVDLGGIKGSSGKPRTRKASWQELRCVLRQLGYHPRQPEKNKKAQIGLAVMIALRTTLRSQEVLELSTSSIDMERKLVRIEKHKTRYTTNDAKVIPLMPKGLVLLQRKCLHLEGKWFSLKPTSRDTMYRKACRAAGVNGLTFHDLKRTAVDQLKKLLNDTELMAVTGNASVEILRRHYMNDTAFEASKIIWSKLAQPAQRLAVK